MKCGDDGVASVVAKVDVIVRGKNEGYWLNYLCQFFDRLQTVHQVTLVYVDNASFDSSLAEIDNFAKRSSAVSVVKRSIETYYPGRALNIGAGASDGDYILNLSAHCIPKSFTFVDDFINEFNIYKQSAPELIGCYGRQLPLPGSAAQNIIDLALTYPEDRRVLRRTPLFNNACSLIERREFSQRQFDDFVTNLEDVIWAKAGFELGGAIAYCPSVEVYHYHGPHQHARSNETGRASRSIKTLLEHGWIEIDTPWFCQVGRNEVQTIEAYSLLSPYLNNTVFDELPDYFSIGFNVGADDVLQFAIENSLEICDGKDLNVDADSLVNFVQGGSFSPHELKEVILSKRAGLMLSEMSSHE